MNTVDKTPGKRGTSRPGRKGLLSVCLAVCLAWGLTDSVSAGQAVFNGAGPLFINELMADNASTKSDPQGHFDDWIEIYNDSGRAISLAGMYLTDDLSNPTKWRFPLGVMAKTMVPAHRCVLVWADGDVTASGLHAGFSLDAKGEEVGLSDANGLLIDAVTFGPQPKDVSFGRYPDGGPDPRILASATPGVPNSTGFVGQVQEPLFSHHRGFINAKFSLTLVSPTPGATILYTTDGSDPTHREVGTSTAKVYTAPLAIAAQRTTCVRAVATLSGWRQSWVVTHTYVVNPSAGVKSLPLISLVAESGQTFYEPNGVAAIVGGSFGTGVWQSTGAGSYNNVLVPDLERPVSFEWMVPADSSGFQVDCGLRVHGSDWMRPRYTPGSKFSWRLYFRDEYGPGKLDYPIFPFKVHVFDDLVLRAGHNDMTNPFVKDELVRRLLKDMGHVSSSGTLVNLFIDGQAKGYFNPAEHITESFCQAWFDSNQPWDVVNMFGGVRDGDATKWNALISTAQQRNLADQAAYNQVVSQIDMNDFVDYLILRLWTGDWDWPQNNWAAACERSPQGVWRFFVWDAEGSFFSDRLSTVYFSSLDSQANEHGYLYRGLKVNPRFRLLFGDRLYKAFFNGGALSAQNVTKRFNELKTQMAGVLPNMDTYVVSTWVPQRQPIFLDACVSEGLYTFAGPTLLINGKAQYGGTARAGDMLTMTTSEPGGLIYYTLDGIDPADRLASGNFGKMTLVSRDSVKRALVPTGPVDLAWRGARTFDDSAWMTCSGLPGGVGFGRTGNFPISITLNTAKAMDGINTSCLVRIPFDFHASLQDVNSLTLKIQYDSAFVAYLNGTEVARRNFTGEPAWNSYGASENSDATSTAFRSIDVTSFGSLLREGRNTLAVHGMNSSISDKDFLINAELIAEVKPSLAVPVGLTLYSGPVRLDHTATVRVRVVSLPLVSALSEATFSVGPVASSLRVTEVMYHPLEGGDPNDPNTEYIELANVGTAPINLNQVRLTGGVDFVFGPMEISSGQRVLVLADPCAFAARYGGSAMTAGRYEGSLSDRGEQLILQDAAGGLIERFEYADSWYRMTDGQGFSLTVVDPGADPNALSGRAGWRPSAFAGGSPGWDDSDQVPVPGSVVITEVMANPDDGQSDWIELHNTTSRPVDISGWFLSDDEDDLARYRIAGGTIIPPGGYVVFYEDRQFANPSDDPGCLRPFALSAAGEAVCLTSGAGGIVAGYTDHVTFGPSEPGVSLGRFMGPQGQAECVALALATPGEANGPFLVGPVVISEVLARPDVMPEAEFVELFNGGSEPVTLYDAQAGRSWRLLVTDGDTGLVDLELPANPPVTIPSGGCVLLVKNRDLLGMRFTGLSLQLPMVQWDQGNLPDTAGTVRLLKPLQMDDGQIQWIAADAMAFPGTTAGRSWQRSSVSAYGQDPAYWRVATPTPGTHTP